MEMPNLRGLEGLTDIGLRGGVDMRPTLLRVLTDLYVQKLTHTAEEDRHYAELALRLLDSVDVAARAAVAARLANHLSPPRRVIERLAADLPEVASALRQRVPGNSAARPAARMLGPGAAPNGAALHQENTKIASATLAADIAGELNELFFAAKADERRLILLNLHIVAALPPAPSNVVRDPTIGRRLEAAALARKREEFAQVLARSLRISRQQARRIAGDQLGEPIVVAAKALAVPREPLYRILLFVNTAVGHSVERVHALATLYDEISLQVAEDLIGIWRALNVERGTVAGSQRSRSASTAHGASVATPVRRIFTTSTLRSVRREAS
jgi:uncharacterized protein (DUF2336 family)